MSRRSSEEIRRDFSESLRRYDMEAFGITMGAQELLAVQHVLSVFCLLGT
jgi:hypothetical protein